MKKSKSVILCVDDDQDTLDILRVALESGGFKVVEALTGEQGLKKFKAEKPDLLIVDLMMEEVDTGTRFVTSLRALGNAAPVFLLSSVGDSLSQQTDYSDIGLAGVFQKPIDPKTLLMTVKAKLPRK